jgi:hypothetical protein
MPFWNLASSEPRRAHRFLLNLPNLAADDQRSTYQEYLCKTVTKPSYTIGETEHKFLGNTYYYPGAVTWETVTAQLVNAVDPDGNAILMSALYRAGYMDPNQQASIYNGDGGLPGTPNKQDALDALGDVIIRELDGSGLEIGLWELKNPFITNVKFGDLDYSTEDLLNIDITFRYDFALYYPGENGEIADNPVTWQNQMDADSPFAGT